jgi:alpha-amylase
MNSHTLHAMIRVTGFLSLVFAMSASAQAPAWTKGAVCYEIFVRSFFDSDGDGIGDFNGLTQKLDYVNDGNANTQRDLGARCIWLMPVAASPSYHGYDATDYYRVSPQYGTNADFKRMVAEAHRRGIRVLVDMVLNHASSDHPYFKDAALNPGSPYRSWFRFTSPQPQQKGLWGDNHVVWHKSPVRDEWYYGIFWHGMPDLNYDNPAVREEAKRVATFWLKDMGVDGFRLDAIPYLVEEGSKLSGTRGTHDFLREYAKHIRAVAPEAYTIGEVWDSVGAMEPYYPDQLDAHFAFELSEALLTAVRTGSSKQMFDGYLRLQRQFPAERWSPFLRNHDQTRTMTVFGGDVARARLATTLLLTLPGLPFVYYGEEIGMTGDKPDPRLRTPMHWTRTKAAGFTTGVPWEPLQPDSLTANVEALEGDPSSLLNLHRRLIHLRAAHSALGQGQLLPLRTSSDAAAAYLRRDGDRVVMVVANLGTAPLRGLRVASDSNALGQRFYDVAGLLGGPAAPMLRVRQNGQFNDYVPFRILPPLIAYIVQLTPRGR